MNLDVVTALRGESGFFERDVFTSHDVARICALAALEKKACDLVILNVANLTSYADLVVICTGLSERQTQAIARNVESEMGEHGKYTMGSEGFVQGHWILLDFGDVIFHVFSKDARQYYDLDGLWSDAARLPLKS